MSKVYVIGIGFRPLGEKASYVVHKSDVVLANNRLLDVFKKYSEYEAVKHKIIAHGSVYEMLDYIADNYQTKKIALLAAGDPMFFGIGRLVVERFGKDAVEVYPDLSSIQIAFSKIRESSNNALLISLHGGPDPEKRRKLEYELGDVPGLLNEHNKIAVLTDKVNSPEKIAETLCSCAASPLRMYVCEKLGYDNEKVTEGTPEQISKLSFEHPNVVIIIRNALSVMRNELGTTDHASRITHHETTFGLKEDDIQHSKGLITKDEVRAVTIHKLKLPQKGVLWDIGAGSGAISVEAARLCPESKVFAIEKSEEQLNNITANISRFNITNIEVVRGKAPEALNGLPAPDRVFIGGSGGRLGDVVKIAAEKIGSGIIIINATTIETLNEAVKSLEDAGCKVDICEVSISRSKTVGGKRHMSALNPIFIITGEKN